MKLNLKIKIAPTIAELIIVLLFGSGSLFSTQLDTLVIPSKAMSKSPKAVVVLPDAYQKSHNRFPVVYLLHGWSGSYRDWPTKMDLKPLADKYGFIIVCPDGGYAGWYVNSPLIKDSQYETYIAKEVVDFIDNNYRTVADSTGRFLCGLSMGGHGAFTLLVKYPERFAGAGCMSGAMTMSSGERRAGLADVLGDWETNRQRWEENSSLFLSDRLVGRDKAILIDCGVDDFLYQTNVLLHKKLLDLKIPHVYIERPGAHTWDYWTDALEYHLLFFRKWVERSQGKG
ncbi:MAG TPA: alpha/beta hydrolase family protein [Candidatus Marinimicrobia bacterium]|nr:alpha/beta hydrolase family protein [Candidatus Neomarinimicrobiota bacterium]HRS51007.1 alpha/beta hydrolase family protein [Candidatus Neomarinimicrobiota bacterium]HRU91651.1 alpha/beta hydrolase family protein [Candidatus Neomarinimicrobiota bacterium]